MIKGEDIESLGYPFIAEKLGKSVFGDATLHISTIWVTLENEIVEIIGVTSKGRDLLFKGYIKDKLELESLLNNLNK